MAGHFGLQDGVVHADRKVACDGQAFLTMSSRRKNLPHVDGFILSEEDSQWVRELLGAAAQELGSQATGFRFKWLLTGTIASILGAAAGYFFWWA